MICTVRSTSILTLSLLLLLIPSSSGLLRADDKSPEPEQKAAEVDPNHVLTPEEQCGIAYTRILSPEVLAAMGKQASEMPMPYRQLQASLRRNGYRNTVLNDDIVKMHEANPGYTKVLSEAKIADQAQSGRCWEFGLCNVQRNKLVFEKKVDKDFDFSKSYFHFFSELEKADKYFAGLVMQLRPGVKKDRLRQVLAPGGAVDDGGYYEWANFIVAKYGMVPKSAMPETSSSQNTAAMLQDLKTLLAQTADEMRTAYKSFKFAKGQKTLTMEQAMKLTQIRANGIQAVYHVLETHLGNPTSLGGKVPGTFRFKMPDGKFQEFSPKTFATDFVGYNPDDYIVVAANPLIRAGRTYVNPGSMIGIPGEGEPISNIAYLNVTPARMQSLIEKAIENDHSVWFAAEVAGGDVDHETGIMHPQIFNRDAIYGAPEGAFGKGTDDRRSGLYYGLRAADHAMVFIGMDKPNPNKPARKFLVENSWSQKAGDDGNYHAYSEWVDKDVYEIVVPRSVLSQKEQEALEQKPKVIKDSNLF